MKPARTRDERVRVALSLAIWYSETTTTYGDAKVSTVFRTHFDAGRLWARGAKKVQHNSCKRYCI